MPTNLTGLGGSLREQFQQQILDNVAKGATAPMAGLFRPSGGVNVSMPVHVEATIFHHTGARTAIVGDTRVGQDNHVVAG